MGVGVQTEMAIKLPGLQVKLFLRGKLLCLFKVRLVSSKDEGLQQLRHSDKLIFGLAVSCGVQHTHCWVKGLFLDIPLIP